MIFSERIIEKKKKEKDLEPHLPCSHTPSLQLNTDRQRGWKRQEQQWEKEKKEQEEHLRTSCLSKKKRQIRNGPRIDLSCSNNCIAQEVTLPPHPTHQNIQKAMLGSRIQTIKLRY
jgi:hypothetical protein